MAKLSEAELREAFEKLKSAKIRRIPDNEPRYEWRPSDALLTSTLLNRLQRKTLADRRAWFEQAIFRPLCKELGLPADAKFDWDVRDEVMIDKFQPEVTFDPNKDFTIAFKQMRAAVLGMPAEILTGTANYADAESVNRLAEARKINEVVEKMTIGVEIDLSFGPNGTIETPDQKAAREREEELCRKYDAERGR